jgi:serine/threonine protein kinase
MEGTYGKVYICNDKVIKKSKNDLCETFIREIYYTSVIPYAIKPLSVLLAKRIRIVYPYGGASAIVAANALPVRERISMLFQLLCKIKWLHDNGIVHNDLMSGNILYDTETRTTHIIDWGLTNYVSLGSRFEIYSEYFKAPELCSVNTNTKLVHHKNYKHVTDPTHTYQTDIWAIGCIAILMLANNANLACKLILENNLKDNLVKLGIPDGMQQIVAHTICEKSQRWSVSKIINEPIFKHLDILTWPPPNYQYIGVPKHPIYKNSYVYMYKLAEHLALSGAVLGNAINIFLYYTSIKIPSDNKSHDLIVQACLSISNKVMGNLYDLSVLVDLPNPDGFKKMQTDVLRTINPHFIVHPIRHGTLTGVYELYLNAISNKDIHTR